MRVRFRTYCQGCRYGTRFAMPLGQRRCADGPAEAREFCVWRQHRYRWEYAIRVGPIVVHTRREFLTQKAAMASAKKFYDEVRCG
jgi:hypothetical protein